jgi:hypothetical protein
MAACAAFRKESRMRFANATHLDRKSGVAQWRDLRLPSPQTDSSVGVLTKNIPNKLALMGQILGWLARIND